MPRYGLEAVLARDGFPFDRRPAGSYVAPPPARITVPRWVRLTRTATGVRVRWAPGAGAQQQAVAVQTGDGLRRVVVVSARARTVRIGGIDRDDRVSATVRGVRHDGRRGPTGRARLAAARPARGR